ncbi:MAG: methylenetetrahydrofolate reductase C-terminal domain-containing protein [Actinobacteria bacterium]|nr:methylenetetrahydrofolate reductase C-terminal domain-containing protein [Actinomycetota bacterium]
MNRTAWKSAEELSLLMGEARRVSIFSCGICANLSGTGGARGIRHLSRLLKNWGKEVVCKECLIACCPLEIMKQAVEKNGKALRQSDALVVISCAAGVKSAFLARPGVPVVPVVDSVGSVPVASYEDDLAARSHCTNCGRCVLAFTGGICPLNECPAGVKYGPCSRYGEEGSRCALDPTRECIWKEVERRGDLAKLERLKELHKRDDLERLPLPPRRNTPRPIRKIAGRLTVHAGWFARFIPLID